MTEKEKRISWQEFFDHPVIKHEPSIYKELLLKFSEQPNQFINEPMIPKLDPKKIENLFSEAEEKKSEVDETSDLVVSEEAPDSTDWTNFIKS